MSQIDITQPEVELASIDRKPLSYIPYNAWLLIKEEWVGHINDIRAHNRVALSEKSSIVGRLFQKISNLTYALLYTGYFWFDDFPARGLTKITDGLVADMLLVGVTSLLVGCAIAFTRRRQLKRIYKKLKLKIVEAKVTISQMANASILGAPNTVKAVAQSGKYNERPIMNTKAILASAGVYAALQSFTAGPVIDVFDRLLPGTQFIGEIIATAIFVATAIYLKSFIEVCYHRAKD